MHDWPHHANNIKDKAFIQIVLDEIFSIQTIKLISVFRACIFLRIIWLYIKSWIWKTCKQNEVQAKSITLGFSRFSLILKLAFIGEWNELKENHRRRVFGKNNVYLLSDSLHFSIYEVFFRAFSVREEDPYDDVAPTLLCIPSLALKNKGTLAVHVAVARIV